MNYKGQIDDKQLYLDYHIFRQTHTLTKPCLMAEPPIWKICLSIGITIIGKIEHHSDCICKHNQLLVLVCPVPMINVRNMATWILWFTFLRLVCEHFLKFQLPIMVFFSFPSCGALKKSWNLLKKTLASPKIGKSKSQLTNQPSFTFPCPATTLAMAKLAKGQVLGRQIGGPKSLVCELRHLQSCGLFHGELLEVNHGSSWLIFWPLSFSHPTELVTFTSKIVIQDSSTS